MAHSAVFELWGSISFKSNPKEGISNLEFIFEITREDGVLREYLEFIFEITRERYCAKGIPK